MLLTASVERNAKRGPRHVAPFIPPSAQDLTTVKKRAKFLFRRCLRYVNNRRTEVAFELSRGTEIDCMQSPSKQPPEIFALPRTRD
jgi:hypothetical protein